MDVVEARLPYCFKFSVLLLVNIFCEWVVGGMFSSQRVGFYEKGMGCLACVGFGAKWCVVRTSCELCRSKGLFILD